MFYADCEGIFSRCVVVARDEYGDWLIDDDLTSEINSAMEGKSAPIRDLATITETIADGMIASNIKKG